MRLLLDTHALLWWWNGSSALSEQARRALTEVQNETFVSPVSAWELATKQRVGKLPGVERFVADFENEIAIDGFSQLPISMRHALVAGSMAGTHRDPFDRMLIAQAMIEGLTLVSNETLFDSYGVLRLW